MLNYVTFFPFVHACVHVRIMYVCVCGFVNMSVGPVEARGVWCPGVGVTGSCEPFDLSGAKLASSGMCS